MRGESERHVSRRTAAAALAAGAATLVSGWRPDRLEGTGATQGSVRSAATASPTLRVRAYPEVSAGSADWAGWDVATSMAVSAVEDALAAIAAFAEGATGLDSVDWAVERGRGVTLSNGLTHDELAEQFRDVVRQRGVGTGRTCHLLLCRAPTNYDIGYGGVAGGDAHVAGDDEHGAFTVANVGATERWDGRSVTENMAIHEVLHTLLTEDVVAEVIDSTCDHDLGTVRRTDDDRLVVSPIATAYAGDGGGGGTAWGGGGCADTDAFYRHDGTDGVEGWAYTTDLSRGTLEATAIYLERYLSE